MRKLITGKLHILFSVKNQGLIFCEDNDINASKYTSADEQGDDKTAACDDECQRIAGSSTADGR